MEQANNYTLAMTLRTLAHAMHTHSSDKHAGEVAETDENVSIRMNVKHLPIPCDF